MATADPQVRIHREWLGSLQPTGVVVAPPALVRAQAQLDMHVAVEQRTFVQLLVPRGVGAGSQGVLEDLRALCLDVLGWSPGDLCPAEGAPDLEVPLPDYDDVLRPTFAVADGEPAAGGSPWMMLIQVLETGTDLDEALGSKHGWDASPQRRFERLLHETRVPVGLLCNGTTLRLVYAPRGETSGYLSFPVHVMAESAGRQIFAAFHMLLRAERLFALPRAQRLTAILADSRRYQSEVSNALAGQVLAALHELLRGFQAADRQTGGDLLREPLREDPDHIYAGLLGVLMRLVFLLFAEDRGLVSVDPVYLSSYSVGGLYQRLREDAGQHPDTMDQRYGAWAQLLALFRLVFDGGFHASLRLPARHGYLFDPDRYPFLEGRRGLRVVGDRADPPLVADGVIYRVLEDLMVLDGDRLSYRNLDVEQIGSVYEAMIGFSLEMTEGPSIAIRSPKPHGAPIMIDLEALLSSEPASRARWLREHADQTLGDAEAKALAAASTPDEAVDALGKRVDRRATPAMVPAGTMVLQPGQERRKSGSYYTPRSLTEPIVATALRPVLDRFGAHPSPEEVLDVRVCDPAMGSGAFLVQACRQLGQALVESWHHHGPPPAIPPDEDEELFARRLVAQRCLYGVDRNPMAVDLAKLSLWLETLARDHAFTFVDHALSHGDSLVGLGREQVAGFHWAPKQVHFVGPLLEKRLEVAAALREEIRTASEDMSQAEMVFLLRQADDAIDDLRLVGDLAVSAFFGGTSRKEREAAREELAIAVEKWLAAGEGRAELAGIAADLRHARKVFPFHWEVEFPEVYGRTNPGFDVIVGNPPFAGKNTLVASNPERYPDWLKAIHVESHGNADLVAHFFRQTFGLLRNGGCLGLLATNTIAQGDTRSTGLRWICTHGGTIYAARKRYRWPGESAAVVVSVVHIAKGPVEGPFDLDGRQVPRISAYLFHEGGDEDPKTLLANARRSFQGSIVLGMGFTFDDTDTKGIASPLSEMRRLVEKSPSNSEVIFPYIGYSEVADSPTHTHHRYVINFGERAEGDCRRRWPDLMTIVETKVKPERMIKKDGVAKHRWWQFLRPRPELQAATAEQSRVLVAGSQASTHYAFAFLPKGLVYSSTLSVIAADSYAAFTVLQSRIHEVWARFFMSTMKDDLAYTPTTCFEPFPFPPEWKAHPALEVTGRAYYEFRAALMVESDEGLTKTYNRFHDPDERSPAILRLRELHEAMDQSVLNVYGWSDVVTSCEFILDYVEVDEEGDRRSARKKPWRYRWKESVRDKVLARLLVLNKQRADEERLAGLGVKGPARRSKGRGKLASEATPPMFGGS